LKRLIGIWLMSSRRRRRWMPNVYSVGEQINTQRRRQQILRSSRDPIWRCQLSRPIRPSSDAVVIFSMTSESMKRAMQGVLPNEIRSRLTSAGYVPRWRSGHRCNRARSRPGDCRDGPSRGVLRRGAAGSPTLVPSISWWRGPTPQRASGRSSERSARLLGHAGGFTPRGRRSRGFRPFPTRARSSTNGRCCAPSITTTWSQRSFEPTLHEA